MNQTTGGAYENAIYGANLGQEGRKSANSERKSW